MSFLNMRFGIPRDSELMAKVQEFSNWGLALVSGQTATLLNLSSEENNTFIGWLGVYGETAHLLSLLEPWLSDWISIWLDGLCLHYFLLEKVRVRVKLTVRLSVSWPIGSVIHITKHSTRTFTSLCNQIVALILSFSHMRLFSHHVLLPPRWMHG